MSIKDQMDNLTSAYNAEYEENYVDAETTPHPTNNAKLAQSIYDAFIRPNDDDFDEMFEQLYVESASGAALDNRGSTIGLPRFNGESDDDYRIRILLQYRVRVTRTQADGIIDAVAALLKTGRENITYDEPSPAEFTVSFDLDSLQNIGVPPSKYGQVVSQIDEMLRDVSAAGVKGTVLITGGAQWDVDTWDDPDAVYGQ